MYTEMGQRGTSSWSSLGNALMDLDAKQAEHLAKGLDAQNQEVQVTAQTAEAVPPLVKIAIESCNFKRSSSFILSN